MRLLIPTYDYKPMLGGIAAYIFELATEFARQGSDVLLLTRKMPNSEQWDQNVPFETRRFYSPQLALGSVPFMVNALKENIDSFKPDAIFCPLWFPDAVSVDIALSLLNKKIPNYFAAHGTEVFKSSSNLKQKVRHHLLDRMRNRVFNNAKKIFPVSHFTRDGILENYSLAKEKVVVVNNGVNTAVFKKTASSINTNDYPRLLTVSRLFPYKGLDMAIRAVSKLVQTFPRLSYTIVGSGPDLARLQEIVKELKLGNHVKFVGRKSQEEIISYYNSSDLFLLLSRNEPPDVEGFGLVFLEAAACGLSSLGGNSGGIPDAIVNSETGWLVDPTNLAVITNKLHEILSDRDILEKMHNAAYANAIQNNWAKSANRILSAIYEK